MVHCDCASVCFVMADSSLSSKPFTFERLCELCACQQRLFSFLRFHKVLFNFHGRCERCLNGFINIRQDKLASEGQIWRCSNTRHCNCKIAIRKHSFFSGSNLRIHVIVKVIYFWTHRYPQHIVVHETGLNPKTLTDFYNFCREVCYTILQQHSEPIGGPGTVVEIDESKFGKRKYNRGKRVDGVWVFGGIERDTTPPKCFFLTVEDRSAATLIPIIKQYILPGTTIVSDCWKSYSSLRDEGFLHQTVNHSIEFVSESGAHTNNIESRWNALKKSLPRYGTRKDLYDSYFAEYCIRRKFLSGSSDPFLAFLQLVGVVYKPPQPLSQQQEQLPTADLASAAHDGLLSTTPTVPTSTLSPQDIATFDLGFEIDIEPDYLATGGDISI